MTDKEKVLAAAKDLNQDVGTVEKWYAEQPLQPFGNKTAKQMVEAGEADKVLKYISLLGQGASG